MSVQSVIEEIAAKIQPQLGGVDWEALEARFNTSREEIVYHTGVEVSDSGAFVYQQYIAAAHDRAKAAISQLTMTWDIKDDPLTPENEVVLAVKAWDQVDKETKGVADIVLQALESQVSYLGSDEALLLDKEKLRAIVSQVYMVALYGEVIHKKLLMQHANVAPEDIVESADDITRSYNALTQLVESGVLDSLKKEQATQGVGAIQVIIIAVVLVAGIALILWLSLAIVKQLEVNKAIKLMCAEAARTGSKEDKERCSNLVELSLTSTEGGPGGGNPFTDLQKLLGSGVMWIGAAVVVGLVLMNRSGSRVVITK